MELQPSREGYYTIGFEPKELKALLGAARERTAKQIVEGKKPYTTDLELCGYAKEGKSTLDVPKIKINEMLIDPLKTFHGQTREMVARIIETRPAFADNTFDLRYQMGQKAGEMVTELQGLVEVNQIIEAGEAGRLA